MIGAVHTILGAALGTFTKSKPRAFLSGVISHAIADALPHNDYDALSEISLIAAALGWVAIRKGTDSPEFWGAIGGITPDVEHALSLAGLIKSDAKIFPTHMGDGKYHGRKTDHRWPQLIAIAVSAFILVSASKNKESKRE